MHVCVCVLSCDACSRLLSSVDNKLQYAYASTLNISLDLFTNASVVGATGSEGMHTSKGTDHESASSLIPLKYWF